MATVTPHVNQIKLHAGMPGSDPHGLVSFCQQQSTFVQAYRPLAHGEGLLLRDETVKAIGRVHGKSAAQVALRWVLQLGHALVTSTEKVSHMVGDLNVFDWELSLAEMTQLSLLDTSPDSIVSEMCVL